jgi:hypothetical protein
VRSQYFDPSDKKSCSLVLWDVDISEKFCDQLRAKSRRKSACFIEKAAIQAVKSWFSRFGLAAASSAGEYVDFNVLVRNGHLRHFSADLRLPMCSIEGHRRAICGAKTTLDSTVLRVCVVLFHFALTLVM